ncbi:MAG: hypothetical protein AAGF12_02890 [Myxococcota bacterium]
MATAPQCLRGALIVLLALGCGETEEEPEPVCVLVRDGALEEEEEYEDLEEIPPQRSMRYEEWIDLMARGGSVGALIERDCAGRAIEWPRGERCGADEDQGRARNTGLTEESVIETRVSATERLVWLVTHRFENGDGLGPAAFVELENDRAKVRTLGPLRARVGRTRLRELGLGYGDILLAEGETCEVPDNPETCARSSRILRRVGDSYVPQALRYPNGRCAGAADIQLSGKEEIELDNGWIRTFIRHASVDTFGGVMQVHEQIIVTDRDPQEPNLPPRTVRELNTDREIRLRGQRFVINRPSHWDALLSICGSTEAPHAADGREHLSRNDIEDIQEICDEARDDRR